MKTGDGSEKNAENDDPCWKKIKESTSPIKQKNKVVYNTTHTAPFGAADSIKKTHRTTRAAFDYLRNLKTLDMCTPYRDSNEKLVRPQFICTEEYGTISGIDLGTKTKVDRGRYKIDATIDLHGYSAVAAYDLLVDFVTSSFEHARKCILVITGWGSKSSGENSLRSNLHHWLQSDKIVNLVLYYKQATPAHGGRGAFYVLLRKNKQKHLSPDGYKKVF